MSRTSQILSRVRLNLGAVSTRPLKDGSIYNQMQEAQKQIILDTRCIEYELEITTVADQAEYDLLYDAGGVNERDCIGEIKEIIVPDTYSAPIDLLPNEGWNSIVNETYMTEQPLFATVFNRQIVFHPAPAAADDVIKLWVYQTNSLQDIAEGIEPEVQPFFDKAIEYFATAMLDESKYEKYMQRYEIEMAKHSGRPSLKHLKGTTHDCEW